MNTETAKTDIRKTDVRNTETANIDVANIGVTNIDTAHTDTAITDIANAERANSSLAEALTEYGRSDFYPYHMPGHKRSQKMGMWSSVYQMDITEIDGFDNLHQPEGLIKQAQDRAARLYGAEETFFLVNGSTCGVLSAIMAVTEKQDTILIARNCHKSVYHGAFLQELKLRYLYPRQIREYGIADAVSPEEVEEALVRYPECKAVVITSPTYEGIIADIRQIAQVVHRYGKILIVDEAHGAHLGMTHDMPENAVRQGADLVINSLHKTLPAMTQTALLHVQGELVNRKKLRHYLSIFQTSSPSYVFMANMDFCLSYLKEQAAASFGRMQKYYADFMQKMDRSRNIRIGNGKLLAGKGYHFTDWDIGKLVISVGKTGKKNQSGSGISLNGQQLYDILRDEFHLQMEMAADSYVLAMMTVMDEEEGWQRLADALLQIDDRIEERAAEYCECTKQAVTEKDAGGESADGYPKTEMTIAEALSAVYQGAEKAEKVLLSEAEGEISGNFINLYPPGIPILVPGEVIGAAQIQKIQDSLQMGLHVQGISEGETVAVCRRIN